MIVVFLALRPRVSVQDVCISAELLSLGKPGFSATSPFPSVCTSHCVQVFAGHHLHLGVRIRRVFLSFLGAFEL